MKLPKHLSRLCSVLLSVILLTVLATTAIAATPETVTSFDELKAAVAAAPTDKSETTIVLGSDIEFTGTINISAGQNITIKDDGTARTISAPESGASYSAFTVETGGTLTVKTSAPGNNDLLIFDGTHFNSSSSYTTGAVFTVRGTFNLVNGTIKDTVVKYAFNGVVFVYGEAASFNMSGGLITGTVYDNQSGGVVYVTAGASFEMTGGAITDNHSDDMNTATIYIDASEDNTPTSRFIMRDGIISDNTANYGGVLVGAPPAYISYSGSASMEMYGGTISGNTSSTYGGGIMVLGRASLLMNDGKIINNSAKIGGGIATYDLYYQGGANEAFTHEEWKQYVNTKFTMNGGTVSGNHAVYDEVTDGGCGGGIYVGSDDVVINAGNITDNIADRQGGGLYVGSVPYTMYIYDALITGNTATILGGGLWFCPTGDAENTVTNGGAIFGNKAENSDVSIGAAGDDFVAVPQNDKNHLVSLADRMLGGGEVQWYADGGVMSTQPEAGNVLGLPDDTPRYNEENPGDRITGIKDSTEGIALKSVVTDNAKKLAESQAKVFITGNTAPRGGGIGSNGAIVIGTPQDEWTLNITKKWAEGISDEDKSPVTVRLKIGEYELDTITLDASNNWSGSFTQLPNPDSLDENPVITAVEEGDEYIVDYEEVTRDDGTKTLTLTLTNSLKPTGGLTVSKTVKGTGADTDQEFSFTVTLDDTSINGTYGEMTFKDGVAAFKLKHGESINATKLPAGISYTVTETDAKGYTVTSTGETGTIKDGETLKAEFVNEKDKIPEKPEGPEEPENPDPGKDENVPTTGDHTAMYIAAAALTLSAIASAALSVKRRKHSK